MPQRQVMILVPDALYDQAEDLRWKVRLSRSEFFRRAAGVFINVFGADLPIGTMVTIERPGAEAERVEIT